MMSKTDVFLAFLVTIAVGVIVTAARGANCETYTARWTHTQDGLDTKPSRTNGITFFVLGWGDVAGSVNQGVIEFALDDPALVYYLSGEVPGTTRPHWAMEIDIDRPVFVFAQAVRDGVYSINSNVIELAGAGTGGTGGSGGTGGTGGSGGAPGTQPPPPVMLDLSKIPEPEKGPAVALVTVAALRRWWT